MLKTVITSMTFAIFNFSKIVHVMLTNDLTSMSMLFIHSFSFRGSASHSANNAHWVFTRSGKHMMSKETRK